MAGFGDSNDIKIKVTVDTAEAIDAAKAITEAFSNISGQVAVDFKQLSESIKTLLNANIAEIKKQSAAEAAEIKARSAEKIAAIRKETADLKELEITKREQIKSSSAIQTQALKEAQSQAKQAEVTKRAEITATYKLELQNAKQSTETIKAAEATKRKELSVTASQAALNIKSQTKAAKDASVERIALIKAEADRIKNETAKSIAIVKQAEAIKRSEAKITAEQLRLEAAKVRKETAQAQIGAGKGGGIGATGGALAALGKISVPLAATGVVVSQLAQLVGDLGRAIEGLLISGGKLEALSTAFNTLQKSVGRDPAASIERLRQATQGLISDTELYQKANQAVLLGVPTKLFEESAEAAVKLGRAMGIDAAFALESLSIGLGRQSRLYLDNLGIVVSATDAYRNFARENNILGRDLTETEKRLAFFNETSRALADGLAKLPPIIDDVGTAYKKLTTTTDNNNSGFLRAFNSSSDLTQVLLELNAITKQLKPAFERAGSALAGLISRFLDADNGLNPLIIKLAKLGGLLLAQTDNFFQLSEAAKRNRFAEIAKDIDAVKNSLANLPKGIGYSKFREERTEQLNAQLKALQAEATYLAVELDTIDTLREREKDREIALRLNTEGVSADISETTTLLTEFKREAEESLGLIKIPGVDKAQLDAAIPSIDSTFRKIEEGGLKAEEAGVLVEQLVNSLAKVASQANLDALANQISKVQDEISKSPASEQLKVDLATLEKRQKLLTESIGLEQGQRDQIKKVLEERRKLVKAQIEEESKLRKKAGTGATGEFKKQQKELERFSKAASKALDTAIPPDFQKRLVDLFNNGTLSAQELEKQLRQIGESAQKAGVDLGPLEKEVRDLAELAKQGIKINVNAEQTKADIENIRDYNEQLGQAQSGVINLRDLIYGAESEGGKKKGGGFFGFDTSEMFGPDTQAAIQSTLGAETFAGAEAAIAKALVDSLKLAIELAFQDFTREDAPQIGQQIGQTLGGDIGGIVGRLIGENILRNTQDLASTKERKNIDRYFSDLFDGERLAIAIDSQIQGAFQGARESVRNGVLRLSDLTFEGQGAFGGGSFGGEGFRDYFNTLGSDIQASFNGVGLALGVLQGVSVEQARLIGVALTNNVGGSLQNLQVLVQQTGESFEDLAGSILDSFKGAQLTIEEAYNALVQLQNIYETGIPGAIGAYEEAINNLNNILQSDRPGQYAIDSLRDIGAEGAEAKKTFDSVISALGGTFGYAADQQARLFEALRANGIASLQQLAQASDEQLLAILRNIELIKENAQAPIVTTPQITSTPKTGASGARGKSPEEERKDALKKLRDETQKLLRESAKYEEIIRKITSGELARAIAGKEIIKLQQEIEKALKRRGDLEKKYEEELAKGNRANKKRLADLAAALDAVNKKIKNITEEAGNSTREFKKMNLAGVIPLIKSANMLGVIANQVGVNFEKASDILVKGFLQGRLTLQELRDELEQTKETLGPGIPNAVGAVTEAFQGLIDAGTQGGQFSVDAFRDIFAEFREKFEKEGSALREAERKQLEENLKVAREAFANAVGPEATAAAKKTLDEAKKSLEDFYAATPTPDLSDLRNQLNAIFGETEVNKFFQALDESGLSTFEDFEKAGTDSIVGILTKLQALGFNFGETSQAIIDAQQELINAETEANAGLDPLQEAINLIKGLNDGAAQLPPVFDSTTAAINNLNGPLTALRDGFDDILEKLAQLDGNKFQNDVVFNVSTVGDAGAQALVDILFGDGAGTTNNVGGTTSGSGSGTDSNAAKIAKWKTEIDRIRKLPTTENRRRRIETLRKRIASLGG